MKHGIMGGDTEGGRGNSTWVLEDTGAFDSQKSRSETWKRNGRRGVAGGEGSAASASQWEGWVPKLVWTDKYGTAGTVRKRRFWCFVSNMSITCFLLIFAVVIANHLTSPAKVGGFTKNGRCCKGGRSFSKKQARAKVCQHFTGKDSKSVT